MAPFYRELILRLEEVKLPAQDPTTINEKGGAESGCAFLAHAACFLKQADPGGSTEDFLTPKEIQDVLSQQAAASCLVHTLLPSLLGFRPVRFATNGPGSEKKTLHQTCFLVWQYLKAERRSDQGICCRFRLYAGVQRLLKDINCQESESSCRYPELPHAA